MESGATAGNIYCVASGLLRVVVSDSAGNEEVTTDFVKRDEFFLASAFGEPPKGSGASLVAALPSSVYVIPWQAFHRLCGNHPELLLGLVKTAVNQTVMLRKQLRRVSCSASEALISRALHELTLLAPAGNSGYDKRITQSVIASYTGLSREQVNKTMREFESRGLVQKDEAGVHVPPGFACSDYHGPSTPPPSASSAGDFPIADADFLDTFLG